MGKRFCILLIGGSIALCSSPTHIYSSDTSCYAKCAFKTIVVPATVGVACGVSGRLLPDGNGIDTASSFVGILGTIITLVAAGDYTEVLPPVSFLVAYLIARTSSPSSGLEGHEQEL